MSTSYFFVSLQRTESQSPSGPAYIQADISPDEFARLTLPVYKAMLAHVPTEQDVSCLGRRSGTEEEKLFDESTPKHYTSASFGRLLALAGRRLRLKEEHFDAVLRAMASESGIHSPFVLLKEQVWHVHECGCFVVLVRAKLHAIWYGRAVSEGARGVMHC